MEMGTFILKIISTLLYFGTLCYAIRSYNQLKKKIDFLQRDFEERYNIPKLNDFEKRILHFLSLPQRRILVTEDAENGPSFHLIGAGNDEFSGDGRLDSSIDTLFSYDLFDSVVLNDMDYYFISGEGRRVARHYRTEASHSRQN